jgi:hypothetical protein
MQSDSSEIQGAPKSTKDITDSTDDVWIKESSKKLGCSRNTDTPNDSSYIQGENREESSKKLDTGKNTDTPNASGDTQGVPNTQSDSSNRKRDLLTSPDDNEEDAGRNKENSSNQSAHLAKKMRPDTTMSVLSPIDRSSIIRCLVQNMTL